MSPVTVATATSESVRWEPHFEAWLLIIGLVGAYLYVVRVLAPRVLPVGVPASTRRQRTFFVVGVVTLWVAVDSPLHHISEELYSAHMVQHLLLTFVMAPAFMLAVPSWLTGFVAGDGAPGWLVRLAHPLPALALFNTLALVSHWQGFVNLTVRHEVFHHFAHLSFVVTAVVLWLPVCGPWPQLRLSSPGQMGYLFVTSIVPTVPVGWLVFAQGAVYSAYDVEHRLWDIGVTADQQAAGVVMKLAGGGFLWLLITIIFFRWAAESMRASPSDAASRLSGATHGR